MTEADRDRGRDDRGGEPGERVLRRDRIRVHMGDTDAAQVIYFAAPYRWREAIFTDHLAASGHPLRSLIADGVLCPSVESGARYLRPVRLDDELALELVAERVGRSSFQLRMDAHDAAGELAVQVRTTNVYSEPDASGRLRAAPLPEWFRRLLATPTGSVDTHTG